MERRSFIRSGVAAGVTAAGLCSLEGCSTSGLFAAGSSRFVEPDVARHLADLRGGAASVEAFSFGTDGNDDLDLIGRQAAGVLSTTQRFRDLPLEVQLHPEIQAYMHRSASDVDDVVWRHTSQIRSTGLLEDPALDAALRSRSNPGLQFLESFDEQAARTGMSAHKRMRLRRIGIESVNRMRHAGAKTALLDVQGKADRMWETAAALGSAAEADRRATILRVGEREYDRRRREVGEIVDHWERAVGYAPELYVAAAPQDPASTEAQLKAAYERGAADAKAQQSLETMKNARYEAGTRVMKTGGWIMGASVIIAGIGGILALVNPIVTLVMSATIGGVMLITGLIVLCVGAGMRHRAANSQV
ncbi:MAG: DUF308 domain-containing protein [Proteobacteria bacterium]|jgi:hypothetical protein|nr:DUF308 domain-containing protein [Pseudomonadota bacterium]